MESDRNLASGTFSEKVSISLTVDQKAILKTLARYYGLKDSEVLRKALYHLKRDMEDN